MAEQAEWEIELTQIRQLMRNEIAAHGRIRERVLRLQEIYQDGVIDGGHNWEIWACDRFAYNRAWLRRMTNPHPLTLDTVARQQQIDHDRQVERELAADRKHTQAAWDFHRGEIELDAKLSDKAFSNYTKLIVASGGQIGDKPKAGKPKKKTARTPQLPLNPPTVAAIAEPHLAAAREIERKSRFELGREYYALRKLAQANRLGRDEDTGKFWTWVKWAAAYIQRSRAEINRCLVMYMDSLSDVSGGDIKQEPDVDAGNGNVVNLPRQK